MIPCFIPSKDRAAQLRLLLQSLEKNAPKMFSPTIMFTHSTAKFAQGYQQLINSDLGAGCEWLPESNAEEQFYSFLKANRSGLVALFSDDCIFYRKTDVCEKTLRNLFDYRKNDVFSFTFRLGKNIKIKDYVTGEPAITPDEYFLWGSVRGWDYRKIPFWQLHGFTVGFDGYVYNAKTLVDMAEGRSFDNRICFWEKMICQQFCSKGSSKWVMTSPAQSCVFVQQINVTHEYPHRTNKTFHCSLEELNNKLLFGYEIALESMNFSNVNCSHGELPFQWEKMK